MNGASRTTVENGVIDHHIEDIEAFNEIMLYPYDFEWFESIFNPTAASIN